jgi:hypothetical protein
MKSFCGGAKRWKMGSWEVGKIGKKWKMGNWEDRKMKKITMRLSKKKAGAKIQITYKSQITMAKITNPMASMHSCIHAISFQLTSFSHLPIFSASHLPSLPTGRRRQQKWKPL